MLEWKMLELAGLGWTRLLCPGIGWNMLEYALID